MSTMMSFAQLERVDSVHERWESWVERFEQDMGRNPELDDKLGGQLQSCLDNMRMYLYDLVDALTVDAAARSAHQLYLCAREIRVLARPYA